MNVPVLLELMVNDCHHNPKTRVEERLARFCTKRVGYASICRCEQPEPVDVFAPPLLGTYYIFRYIILQDHIRLRFCMKCFRKL